MAYWNIVANMLDDRISQHMDGQMAPSSEVDD